jgi:hypothetical protein
MSYATKTNGFRTIMIDGVRYRWRFRPGREDSVVTLQGSESGCQQAIVRLPGVRDPWYAFPYGDAQLVSVTPRTVSQIVRQALARGWEPRQRAVPLTFDLEFRAEDLLSHQN